MEPLDFPQHPHLPQSPTGGMGRIRGALVAEGGIAQSGQNDRVITVRDTDHGGKKTTFMSSLCAAREVRGGG